MEKDLKRELKNRLKKDLELIKNLDSELKIAKQESLRMIEQKRKKQISLVNKKCNIEKSELLKRFDKKELKIGDELLREKQKKIQNRLQLEKRFLSKNNAQIRKLEKEL